ncbi:MAG: hypothetical protein JXB05_23555 [Myxococcaceae bacterium]|nr:hypothetical protein [Myxococcaceae bacterium]
MKKLLVFVVLLAVGAAAAHHFGYLDRLLPSGLGARFIPKDAKLLAYFSPDTRELLVLQATELDLRLPEESRRQLEQDWRELQEKTGVDPRKDVDAFAAADGLAVVRGRFDWARLGAWLQSEGYTLTALGGVPAAVKPRTVDVALDGKYLLLGQRSELERALARKRQDKGLAEGSPIVRTLDEIGWKHTLVGGVVSGSRLSSQGPEALKPQSAVAAFDSTPDGFELRAAADTRSKEEGEAIHAALELLRKTALLEMSLSAKPEVRTLREALERARLEVDPQGRVSGSIRLPYALAEQATANLSRDQLPAALQSMELPDEPADTTPLAPPPAVTPEPPAKDTPAPATAAAASQRLDWKPPVFGLILLVLSLLTMGAQARPGLFNVLFHPLFLLPFLISTLGVFVLRWTGPSGGAFELLTLPLPEWHRFVSLPVAQPIGLSAAIPMLFALLAGAVPPLKRFAAGLGVGFSSYLAAMALAGGSLALIPPAYTVIWFAGNALAALLLARMTIPQRVAKKK